MHRARLGLGAPLHRVEGREKVTGSARYAAEYPAEDLVHAWPVLSDIAAGRVTDVDTAGVEKMPGVLRVWWHGNAPVLADVGDADARRPAVGRGALPR